MPRITVTLDYEVEEPAVRTLFGACPAEPGGQSKAAADMVPAKWGSPVAVRQFMSTFKATNTSDDYSLIHTSYKQNNDAAGIAAGNYDDQIAAVAQSARPGDVLEWMHEHDKKVSDGVMTYAQLVAAKNRFYDVVKATNPSVLVACTVTGWEMEPAANQDTDQWGALKGDLFGLDADGVHPTKLPYPNFTKGVQAVKAFIQKYAHMGYVGWCVPEFGAPRMAVDPDGTERAEWAAWYADHFTEQGAHYVAWFDYDMGAGYELNTAAELAAWKAACGTT